MAQFGAPERLTDANGIVREYSCIGKYRTSIKLTAADAQAANARIFEIRNTHAFNLIVPTMLTLKVLQTAAGTAQLNSLDCYKVTGFTAVDTTNTVTPTKSTLHTAMAAYPGGAAVRHVTVAGAAAGMTGGTLTKDVNFFATLPFNVATSVATTPYLDLPIDQLDKDMFVFSQNEGLIIENSILNVTSYGVTFFIDFIWKEMAQI